MGSALCVHPEQIVSEKQLPVSVVGKWNNIRSSGFKQMNSASIKTKVALNWNILTKNLLRRRAFLLETVFFPKWLCLVPYLLHIFLECVMCHEVTLAARSSCRGNCYFNDQWRGSLCKTLCSFQMWKIDVLLVPWSCTSFFFFPAKCLFPWKLMVWLHAQVAFSYRFRWAREAKLTPDNQLMADEPMPTLQSL